jgi:uncharacterized protein GlcG (DUF336 family)
VPIIINDAVVGAIGVSSGTAKQDVKIAEAGLRAISDLVRRSQGPRL